MTKDHFEKYKDAPRHRYLVPIVGGINRYYEVIAPTKTFARWIAQGEVQSWIKVKGHIIDKGVVENERM